MTLGSSCFFVAVIEPCDQGSQEKELTLAYGSRAIRIREHTAEAGGSGRKPRAHILNQKNKPRESELQIGWSFKRSKPTPQQGPTS